MIFTKELLAIYETNESTVFSQLASVPIGSKPTGKLFDFLSNLSKKANEQAINEIDFSDYLDDFSDDDDAYNEIQDAVTAFTMRVNVHENGLDFEVNVDLDDIGGESTNYENIYFDKNGNFKPSNAELGKLLFTFDGEDSFMRH